MPCQLQPESEHVSQQLRLMDLRLDQQYPGYLAALEQLRQTQPCHQEGEWNASKKQMHTWKGQEQ